MSFGSKSLGLNIHTVRLRICLIGYVRTNKKSHCDEWLFIY